MPSKCVNQQERFRITPFNWLHVLRLGCVEQYKRRMLLHYFRWKEWKKNTKSEHGTWNVNFDFKMPENERIWIWHTDQMWIEFTTITANSIFCEYTDIQSILNKIIPFCFWFNCKKLHSIKGLQIVCVFLYCVTNLSRMKW